MAAPPTPKRPLAGVAMRQSGGMMGAGMMGGAMVKIGVVYPAGGVDHLLA